MPLFSEVIALAVPRGARLVGEKVELQVSVVFSPMVVFRPENKSEKNGPLTPAAFPEKHGLLADWVARTKLPWDAEQKLKMAIVKDGWKVEGGNPVRQIDPATAAGLAVKLDLAKLSRVTVGGKMVDRAQSQILWKHVFGNAWALPVEAPTAAVAAAAAAFKSVASPEELRAVLRNEGSSVEGISSVEVNRLVCCGMAAEAVSKPKDKIPFSLSYFWETELRRMDFAIERQRQHGAAGGASAAARDEEDATRDEASGTDLNLRDEFHRRLSMVDDYPELVRVLGLIVDVTVETSLQKDEPALVLLAPNFELDGLNVRSCGTACRLEPDPSDATKLRFYAWTPEEGRLLAPERCVRPSQLETVQWDLESGLRSVLRARGFQQGDVAGKTGATSPAGYGITVYWKGDTKALQDDTATSTGVSARGPGQELGTKVLTAEDLVLGFVPAMRQKGDKTWRSLTHRALSLQAGGSKFEWSDELALAATTADAPQPLAGWVLEILDRTVSPGSAGKVAEQWYYLLSTPGGFVVVKENVDVEYFSKLPDGASSGPGSPQEPPVVRRSEPNPQPGAPPEDRDQDGKQGSTLFDQLPAMAREDGVLRYLGQFVEFRGRWETVRTPDGKKTATGCFLSHDATVRAGVGLAGRVTGAPRFSTRKDEDKYYSLMSLAVTRKEVVKVDQTVGPNQIPIAGAGATQAGPRTFVYLRSVTPHKVTNPLLVEPKLRPNLFFQGRGEQALAVVDEETQQPGLTESLRKAAPPSAGAALRFKEMQGAQYVFNLEAAKGDATLEERLRPVQISFSETAKILLLYPRGDDRRVLTPGSVYQVYVEAVYNAEKRETTLQASRVVEVAPAAYADFYDFRKVDGQWVARFSRSSPGDLSCSVDAEHTRVALATSAVGLSFSEEPAEAAGAARRKSQGLQGNWLELGARIGRGDKCHLQLRPIGNSGDDVRYQLDSVEVVWNDPQNVRFAYRAEPVDEREERDESTFTFVDLNRHKFSLTLSQGDGPTPATTILSLPAKLPPERPWRQWHTPPRGYLLRIFQAPATAAPQRIEVINTLDSVITAWDPATKKMKVKLAVFSDPVDPRNDEEFAASPALAALLESWNIVGKKKGATDESGQRTADVALADFLVERPVTLRLGTQRTVDSIVFILAGQDISSGAAFEWRTEELDVKIPEALQAQKPPKDPAGQLQFVLGEMGGGTVAKISLEDLDEETVAAEEFTVQLSAARPVASALEPDPKESLAAQQSGALVVTAGANRADLIGKSLPLMVEVVTPEVGDEARQTEVNKQVKELRARYLSLLKAAFETGYPLAIEAQTALVIDDAGADAADWDLLDLTVPETEAVVPQLNFGIALGGTVKGAQFSFKVGAGAGPKQLAEGSWTVQNFNLVACRKNDEAWAIPTLPEIKFALQPGKPFTPPKNDQILATDVLLHFNGWSLAVDPKHLAKRKEELRRERKERPPILDVKAELSRPGSLPPEAALPRLRVGREYEFVVRVMDLAGHVVALPGTAWQPTEILPFRPFGSFSQEAGQKLLRFDPLAAPLVWQSAPVPELSVKKTKSAAESLPTGAFVEEVVLLSDRLAIFDDALKAQVQMAEVRLTALPPPAHWHLAEVLGEFDRTGTSPEATHQRIVKGQDWASARAGAFTAARPMPAELWSDSVADPGVKELLVLGKDEQQCHRVPVSRGRPATLLLKKSKDLKPVVQNLRMDDPFKPDSLPALIPGQAASATLEFPPDIDTIVRIYGLGDAPNALRSGQAQSHMLVALSRAALREGAGGGLREAFEQLQKGLLGEDQTPPELPKSAIQEWLSELEALAVAGLSASSDPVRLLIHPWVATERRLRVRHVTNRPYTPPRLVTLEMKMRILGQMDADFFSIFHVHRPSTGALSLQAALEQEYTDDPASALPSVPDEELLRVLEDPLMREDIRQRLRTLENQLLSPEKHPNVQVLGRTNDLTTLLGRPPLDLTNILPAGNPHIPPQGNDEERFDFRQDFQDTRHRTVFYRGVSHTRFGREFFGENYVETNPATIHTLEKSSDWVRVEVPATARPADVGVADITVLLEWSGGLGQGDEHWHAHGETFSFSRTRRSGHRVWLQRPWYSSGSGEKLAVLLWMDAHVPWHEGQEYARLVSRWGVDPVFEVELPSDQKHSGLLTRADFVGPWAKPMGLKSRPMRPNSEEMAPAAGGSPGDAKAALVTDEGRMLPVGLAVYTPHFHPQKKLWYVDLFVEPKSYMPFVSYAVARYQPCSLPECALSNAHRLRMLQPLPVRTLTLRAANRGLVEIDVTLSGIFPPQNRRRITIQIERNPFLEELAGPPGGAPPPPVKENDSLGWEPIPILSAKGVETPGEVIENPKADLTSVQTKIRLATIPWHQSRWVDRVGGLAGDQEAEAVRGWPCRFLRLTILEDEIFPMAHGMPEDQREGPRRIYSDQVMLPQALLAEARVALPEVRQPAVTSQPGGPAPNVAPAPPAAQAAPVASPAAPPRRKRRTY